jgi:hypothetical protein
MIPISMQVFMVVRIVQVLLILHIMVQFGQASNLPAASIGPIACNAAGDTVVVFNYDDNYICHQIMVSLILRSQL